jgi:hypothetical protein
MITWRARRRQCKKRGWLQQQPRLHHRSCGPLQQSESGHGEWGLPSLARLNYRIEELSLNNLAKPRADLADRGECGGSKDVEECQAATNAAAAAAAAAAEISPDK